MTTNKNQILLWIFLISTFMHGVVWEAIGWIALLFIMFNSKGIRKPLTFSANEIKTCFVFCIIILYVVLQINMLHLNIAQTIRLYGITKSVIAFLIVYFFLNRYIQNNDILSEILPLIFILNIMYIIYLITGLDIFNVIGGSRNYLGAINVLFIPYILKFIPKEKKVLKFVWISKIILIAFFIGSRTTFVLTVAAFLLTGLMEKGIKKKFRVAFICLLSINLICLMLPIIGKNANFSRAFSVFKSISDQARSDLADSMWEQYNNYSYLQKLIGNGNNLVTWREAPPHNFIYELLLCYGKIGTILFVLGIVIVIVMLLKSKSSNKRYSLLIIGLTLIVGLVQPFITSGYLFQCLVAIVTLAILNRENPIGWSSIING